MQSSSVGKKKEEAFRKSLIVVHQGLANIYNHRLFQYIRPEFCIKLTTSTEKYGKMEYYIQLLGFYHGTLPGIVIYNTFEDFLSMIYKEQSIDNLAAAKKAKYIVFLGKNHKSNLNDPLNGIGLSLNIKNNRRKDANNNSPYSTPQSRVSATHWHMIKEYNVCAQNPMNQKLPMIPCFTPRLEKLNDPQKTLHSLIWITYCLHYLFIDYDKDINKKYLKILIVNLKSEYAKNRTGKLTPLTNNNRGRWRSIDKYRFLMSEMGGFKLERKQREIFVTYPYGLENININNLSLRPWLNTLPYIFNTMKNYGDGLKYFEKKLTEAKDKIKLRKINEDNYLKDPSGIDYVTAIKGIVGCYMKIGVINNKYYTLAINDYLNKVLNKWDLRDTLKCRNLKLKCLLFSYNFKQYLLELKKEKFYDEKKIHRIDSTLSWNVTFCYFKLYGNKHMKTIESIKKSIANHSYILYCLINIKSSDCTNLRNQRDLNRHLTYYYEYGQFWLSNYDTYRFIICDILYYYLDSKSRPIQQFICSQNRPFTINKTPILHNPKCINTNCRNNKQTNNNGSGLIQCKICYTTFFCSQKCKEICIKDKKHSIQCEMIKKTKRIYKHYIDKIFEFDLQLDEKKCQHETKMNNNNKNVSSNPSEPSDDDPNGSQFVWGDDEENSLAAFMQQLQQNNLVNLHTPKMNGKKQRKSIEKGNYDKNKNKKEEKSEPKKQTMKRGGRKRRGSVELET